MKDLVHEPSLPTLNSAYVDFEHHEHEKSRTQIYTSQIGQISTAMFGAEFAFVRLKEEGLYNL